MKEHTNKVIIPSEWVEKSEFSANVPVGTEHLVPTGFESTTPTHLPLSALDGSFTTWYGAAFGQTLSTLQIDMGTRVSIDVVKVYWRFVGAQFQFWGKQKDSDIWTDVFSVTENAVDGFITTRRLQKNERFRYLQVEMASPHETYSGQDILGLRELEFYSFLNNVAHSKVNLAVSATSPQTSDEFAMKAIDGLPDAWEKNDINKISGLSTRDLNI